MEYCDGKLSAVGADLHSLTDLDEKYQGKVEELDVSENELQNIDGLNNYATLKTLILDNNNVTNFDHLPHMSKLETLWMNKNGIEDLDALLEQLQGRTPCLQYLSLLGNPVCKNELTGCSKDECSRYRVYVAHHIPSLMFLDASPLTAEEKQQARTRGNFLKVAKAQEAAEAVTLKGETEFYKDQPTREGNHSTFLGYQKHGYSGIDLPPQIFKQKSQHKKTPHR